MMLNIHMLREAQGLADERGDAVLYPRNWNGSADGDFAVYAVAMGYAQAIGDWPEEILLSLEVVRAIVGLFRAADIEPTQKNVADEITLRLALAEQEAREALSSGASVAHSATAPAASAGAVSAPEAPVKEPQPKTRKKA